MKFIEFTENKAARSWSIRFDFKLFVVRITIIRRPMLVSLNQHRIPWTKSFVQVVIY